MRRQKTLSGSGVSVTTGYILNMGMATVVISIIILSLSGITDRMDERSTESQLKMLSERTAAEIEKADRLSRISENSEGEVDLDLPNVDNNNYEVTVSGNSGGGTGTVHVVSQNVNVSSTFHARVDVGSTTFNQNTDVDIVYGKDPVLTCPEEICFE